MNAKQIESKYISIHHGDVPHFTSKCECGHEQEWGTTGYIPNTVTCSKCKKEIVIDFFGS